MLKYGNFIKVDGVGFANQTLYETEVIKLLKEKVSRTRVGMYVLYEVLNSGLILTINPPLRTFRLVDADSNPLNSHPIFQDRQPVCGKPVTSRLHYVPGDYYPASNSFIDVEPFFGNDDTLVHELFHKARMFQGLFCVVETNDPYDKLEEFFAITITNIYLSEVGKNNRLRGGHSALIESLRLNSYDFFMKYELRLHQLKKEMPKFFELISTVNCSFNPIRAYMEYVKEMRGENRT